MAQMTRWWTQDSKVLGFNQSQGKKIKFWSVALEPIIVDLKVFKVYMHIHMAINKHGCMIPIRSPYHAVQQQ